MNKAISEMNEFSQSYCITFGINNRSLKEAKPRHEETSPAEEPAVLCFNGTLEKLLRSFSVINSMRWSFVESISSENLRL